VQDTPFESKVQSSITMLQRPRIVRDVESGSCRG
jgi:hypothetical protein